MVNAMNGTQASLHARKPDVMRRGQEGIPEEVMLNSLYPFLKRPAVGCSRHEGGWWILVTWGRKGEPVLETGLKVER